MLGHHSFPEAVPYFIPFRVGIAVTLIPLFSLAEGFSTAVTTVPEAESILHRP